MNTTKLSKSILAGAAVSGLIAGAFSAKAAPFQPGSLIAKAGQADVVVKAEHACKGQNACKGQGGCKSGDAASGSTVKSQTAPKSGAAASGSKVKSQTARKTKSR